MSADQLVNPAPLIDTHAHPFLCKTPLAKLLANAAAAQVIAMLNVGTDIASSRLVVEQAASFPQLIPAVGIHPCSHTDADKLAELEQLLVCPAVKAVGEIGLDYYRNYAPPEKQKTLFRQQLQLAQKYALPVLIHNRQADEDTLAIINEFPSLRVLFHCFSTDVEFIKKVRLDAAFFSFAGNITYALTEATKAAIEYLPLDKIMVETDCPYLTPAKYRGRENQSAYVVETASLLSELKNQPVAKLCQQTTANAQLFFDLTAPE